MLASSDMRRSAGTTVYSIPTLLIDGNVCLMSSATCSYLVIAYNSFVTPKYPSMRSTKLRMVSEVGVSS